MDCKNTECEFNSEGLVNSCARSIWHPARCKDFRSLPNGNLTVDEMWDILDKYKAENKSRRMQGPCQTA